MTLPGGRPQVEPLSADEHGVHARIPTGTAVDVLFDGRRVWSPTTAGRKGRRTALVIPWPQSLLPHLDGVVHIEIREHGTDRPLAAADVVLGTGQGRVQVVDERGRELTMHKWGKLGHVFADLSEREKQAYLDQVQTVLDVLSTSCQVPAFVSFGTLLGAVRDGHLIGHDLDVDLGYYSSCTTPVDVIRESFRIERTLAAETGWRVTRANGGFLQLFPPQLDGTTRNLDVFSCFCTDAGRLYQINDIGTTGDRSAVLPLQQVELEGRQLPAPARPEVFLQAAYGEGWRVPDPTFRYRGNPTRRRMRMWVGGLREDRDRWSRFYRDHATEIPTDPTPYARSLTGQVGGSTVVDIGCGNGRDVTFLARNGASVIGLDISLRALKDARKQSAREHLPATYGRINLASLRDTLLTGADLAAQRSPTVVLARFLVHGLAPRTRDNFWRLTRMLLRGGGRAFLEFRVSTDPPDHLHFEWAKGARSMSPDVVAAEASAHGAVVASRVEARGLAPFKNEDPLVCRMTLEWPTPAAGDQAKD